MSWRPVEVRSLPPEEDEWADTATKIIGEAPIMRELLAEVRTIGQTDATVLIEGETGVGKNLMARTLHELGPRSARPFVSLNAANLPESLFESELFGHVRGSFSGAYDNHKGLARAADRGTLFIDEVGELPLSSQAKLLGFLDHQEVRPVGGLKPTQVDVRIIAATNRDLQRLVDTNTFRRDLYYRLRVVALRIPSLRERPEDLPLLVEHFLGRYCEKYDKKVAGISPDALRALQSHDWKGNIRELENEMERAVILTPEGRPVQGATLTLSVRSAAERERAGVGVLSEGDPATLKESRLAAERQVIQKTLSNHRWNVSAAARTLGISRVGLTRKLKRLGIHRPGKEPDQDAAH